MSNLQKLLIQQKHEKRNINSARQTCIHAILCISGPKQHCDKDHKKRTVWLYFRVSLVYYFRAQRIILHLSFVFCVSIRMESFMIRVSYKHFLIPQSINDSNQLHYVIQIKILRLIYNEIFYCYHFKSCKPYFFHKNSSNYIKSHKSLIVSYQHSHTLKYTSVERAAD